MLTRKLSPTDPRTFKNAKRHHMFGHLLKQPAATRTLLNAENDCRVHCRGKGPAKAVSGHWGRVATDEDFDGRILMCEAEAERQRVDAAHAEVRRVGTQQGRNLAWTIMSTMLAIRVDLEVNATPEGLQRLREHASTPAGARAARHDALRAAALLPSLIQAERLVHGLNTESIVVQDEQAQRAMALDLAMASDPAAVDLMTQLLDRRSQLGKSEAPSDQ